MIDVGLALLLMAVLEVATIFLILKPWRCYAVKVSNRPLNYNLRCRLDACHRGPHIDCDGDAWNEIEPKQQIATISALHPKTKT